MDLAMDWYQNMLDESERRAIVKNIAGAMEYGLTRSRHVLSERVRMAIRREYRRITSKSYEQFQGEPACGCENANCDHVKECGRTPETTVHTADSTTPMCQTCAYRWGQS
jgi:hypothetical protein